ncbi:MAG TPA: DUF2723 domain-containing protein [Anaerolineae bacterium]|nr:DUF2723 domain-containing protein [Anaerolineae bacterium]
MAWHRTGDLALAVACFSLSLLLYLRTLAPTVVQMFDDSLEFALAVHRMAIAHPTGYPLYLLLGKLFSLLPWRDVAGRVNLLSAVAGAVAVALVFLVTRQLARRRWIALLPAAAFAVSPVFWSEAVIAEVYTLNAAFVAGLLLAALRWARRPLIEPSLVGMANGAELDAPLSASGQGALSRAVKRAVTSLGPMPARLYHRAALGYRRLLPEVPSEERPRLHPGIYGLAALMGLSLTHHRTALLLAPAILLFVILVERQVATRAALLGPEHPRWPRWRRLLARPSVLLPLSFLGPLLLYLYLPVRGHVGSLDGTYVDTWRGFWHWVTAGSYATFLGDNPLARSMDAADYAGLFWAQLGPVGLALALLGIAGLVRKPKALALTGSAFALYLVFGVLYRAPDLEVFFIPCFLIAAVWAGVGLDYALDLMRIRGPSLALRRLQAAAGLLLLLGAVTQTAVIGARTLPDVDLSQRWEVHDLAQYWLRPALAPEGTLVGLLGEVTLVRYFQETEGLAPGLRTRAADDPAARLAAIEADIAQGHAVYLTRSLEGLPERTSLRAVTGIMDVAGQAEALVRAGEPSHSTAGIPNPSSLEAALGVELLGWSLSEHGAHGRAWAALRLWWRAPQGVDRPFKVSARLVDAQGDLGAAVDGEPVAWTYPATAWRPGEVVADAYEIPWHAGAAPGHYTPLVILYDPTGGQELGRVELPARPMFGNPRLPAGSANETGVARAAHVQFGEVRLLGLTPPDPLTAYAPGDRLAVTLLWQASARTGDLRLEIGLEGVGALLAAAPVGGSYPSSRWVEGDAVRQVVRLELPPDLEPGSYRLALRVFRDGHPVAWSRGLLPGGSEYWLGTMAVR